MAASDVFNSLKPESVHTKKGSILTTSPTYGLADSIDSAISVPSVNFKAAGYRALDFITGQDEMSPEELRKLYPHAPKELFDQPLTERMADWRVERQQQEDIFNQVQAIRDYQNPNFSTIKNFGINILKETSPTDLAVDMAIGAAISPMVAFGAIRAGTSSFMGRGLNYLAGESIGAFIAKETIEAAVSAPVDYGIRKYMEKPTGVEATWEDSVYGAIGGMGLSIGGNLLIKGVGRMFKKSKRVSPDVDGINKENYADFLHRQSAIDWDRVEVLPRQSLPNNVKARSDTFDADFRRKFRDNTELEYRKRTGKHSDYYDVDNLDPDSKATYKIYSHSDLLDPEMEDGFGYAIFNSESPRQHNSVTSPFGKSVSVSYNASDLRAFSAAYKQGGQLVKIDLSKLKIYKILDDGTEEALTIKAILEDFGFTGSLDNALKAMRESNGSDIVESMIEDFLRSKGYVGVDLPEVDNIIDKSFKRNNVYLFDGIADLPRTIIDELDGSLGALPESVSMYNLTKRQQFDYGDGFISNGKKISLDPNGYVKSDPFWNDPIKRAAYIEYFSEDQIKHIDESITKMDYANIRRHYKDITDETVEYLKQLKMYEELETEMSLRQAMEDEAQLEIHKLFIDQMKEKKVKPSKITIERTPEVEELIKKSVEQLAKEGKAGRLLDEAGIDKITKEYVNRLESALKQNKLDRAYSLTSLYEEAVERLKTANPDITDEIIKAADFCLRKNTL